MKKIDLILHTTVQYKIMNCNYCDNKLDTDYVTGWGLYPTGVTDNDKYKFCNSTCNHKFYEQVIFCKFCHKCIDKNYAIFYNCKYFCCHDCKDAGKNGQMLK